MDAIDGEAPRKRRASREDSLSAPVYTGLPAPPYIFTIAPILWLTLGVDPARLRPHVPQALRLSAAGTAHLALWQAQQGWGIAHTSSAFPSFVIEDHPSPDTAEAAFIPSGVIGADIQPLIRRNYARFETGRCEIRRSGDEIVAAAFQGDILLAEARVDAAPLAPSRFGSVDRYVGLDEAGDLVSSLVSVTGEGTAPPVTGFRIGPEAPPVWQALADARPEWSHYTEALLANWSEPRLLFPDTSGGAAEASRQALLDLLDRHGRAATVLRPDGLALAINARARRLLMCGDRAAQPFRLCAPADGDRVLRALDRAVRLDGGASGHLSLPRPGGGLLILEMAALDPALAGGEAVLVLIRDPGEPATTAGAAVLQLLGLTPSEARVAAAVGAGLTPRAAAARLGLTESTVRSTLKLVFAKLGLSRQVDLVQLVARLSG